jgi:hypothetical protein
MAKRKLIDLTGAPFIVEQSEEEGKWFIIGIKLRSREFLLSDGLPDNIVERLSGETGNDRIDGLDEVEEFFEGVPEGSKLGDAVPGSFVSDNEVTDAWQAALAAAAGNLDS